MLSGSSNLKSQHRMKSKLSSLFSQKPGHWTDFHIELDHPHKIKRYGPGDLVTGTVVLNVAKPLGITHIVVSIYGYVQIFKNPSKTKPEPRISGNRPRASKGGRWTTEYYGDGYASLFEEEIVLWGVSRLDPKLFHFRFELRFPKGGVIPSSVDFERGTIAYHIQATLTRPTAISPTATCDRKIYYRDDVDVSSMEIPKPFVFDLEPVIPTGQRAKSHAKQFASTHAKHKKSSLLSRTDTDFSNRTATSTVTEEEDQSHRPPSTSASSSHSRSSGIIKEFERNSDRRSSQASQGAKDSDSTTPQKKKISVSIHLSKAACLPGDYIHITVSINHTKRVKSINGIIVTLYRQSGVDMHPHLPITAREQNGKRIYEDYYPRSRTGLGGLSLSAAGSSQMWRKDLSQTVKPLLIDPKTLATEVKLSLLVPDGALETINNVPGGMISFKYHLEVIVDIQGKLDQQGSFPGLGLTTNYSNPATSQVLEKLEDGRQVFTMSESDCIDTRPIRREKSVLTCIFDLIVGTRDSGRAKGKQREVTPASIGQPESVSNATQPRSILNGQSNQQRNDSENAYEMSRETEDRYYDGYYGNDYDYYNGYGYDFEYGYGPYYDPQIYYPNHSQQIYPPFPRADLPNEDHLTEKERLQRAEGNLLPSQPPVEEGPSNAAFDLAPSAPVIAEEVGLQDMPSEPESVPSVTSDFQIQALPHLDAIAPAEVVLQSHDLSVPSPFSNELQKSTAVTLEADRIATIDHASSAKTATNWQPSGIESITESSREDEAELSVSLGDLSGKQQDTLPSYEG